MTTSNVLVAKIQGLNTTTEIHLYFFCNELLGGLAAGVPGEIKGLWLAHQIGGKLPWRDLLQPTIKLLKDGFVIGKPVAAAMLRQSEVIKTYNGLRQ